MIKRNLKYVLNRYVGVSVFLLVWMFFFDSYDFRSQIKLNRKIKSLEETKLYYQTEIERTRNVATRWNNDPKEVERYARERYLMKKDNEDLYIVVKKTGEN